MKKIKTLRIGAQRYGVVMQEDHVLEGIYGRVNHKMGVIEINKTVMAGQKADTFVHEVLHALITDAGLAMGEDEEKFVRALAPRLTAFLGDNKVEVRELLKVL